MDSELVYRLRLAAKPEELASVFTLTVCRCSLLREAADEIVALADQLVDMQAELDDHQERHDELLALLDFMAEERSRLQAENVRLQGSA